MDKDPWYDYLALPVAPLVLVAQVIAIAARRRLKLAINATGSIAIAAMTVVAWVVPTDDPGANIGGGVLIMWLAVSLAVLGLSLRGGGPRKGDEVG